jgi:DUF1680 family protein
MKEFAEHRATILVTLLRPVRRMYGLLPAARLKKAQKGARHRTQRVGRNIRATFNNLTGEIDSYQVTVQRKFPGVHYEFARHVKTPEQAVSYRDRLVKAHADAKERGLPPDEIIQAMRAVPLYEL